MSATARAIFAGGCFWCTQAQFAEIPGVISVTSGYTGGHTADPTYEQVCSKKTGHYEAVEIVYDPDKTPYETLLNIFWSGIDPTDDGGQFFDRGTPYYTAVFYTDDAQRKIAAASKEKVKAMLGKEVPTRILPASPFYPAEGYHQDYYRKNAVHYNAYKRGSGRERRLREIWRGSVST